MNDQETEFLDREAFMEWIRYREFIGYSNSRELCPIAEYLRDQLDIDAPQVWSDVIAYLELDQNFDVQEIVVEIPEWAQIFCSLIDDLWTDESVIEQELEGEEGTVPPEVAIFILTEIAWE